MIRPDIKEFVEQLEMFAKQRLNYPEEVSELIQIVIQTGLINEFEELVFQAKFLSKTQEVIKRIGVDADGYEKLSMEFQSGFQRVIGILMILMSRAPAELAQKFNNTFIILEKNNIDRLTNLLSDLELIKNWQIDGKLLPYEINSSKNKGTQKTSSFLFAEEKQEEEHMKVFSRIKRSAASAIIFYILFLLIDPPVTIIGLILSLGIAAFLAYIVIQLYVFKRTRKS